jgi:hypothetical protein
MYHAQLPLRLQCAMLRCARAPVPHSLHDAPEYSRRTRHGPLRRRVVGCAVLAGGFGPFWRRTWGYTTALAGGRRQRSTAWILAGTPGTARVLACNGWCGTAEGRTAQKGYSKAAESCYRCLRQYSPDIHGTRSPACVCCALGVWLVSADGSIYRGTRGVLHVVLTPALVGRESDGRVFHVRSRSCHEMSRSV